MIRIDRAGSGFNIDQQSRGKSSIAINMKSDQGAAVVRRLTDTADVFLDPFRPGVMERLNVGPRLAGFYFFMVLCDIICSFSNSQILKNVIYHELQSK